MATVIAYLLTDKNWRAGWPANASAIVDAQRTPESYLIPVPDLSRGSFKL